MARLSAAGRGKAADPVWVAGNPSEETAGRSRDDRFLRDLVDGMRCGVLSVDRGGRLVMLNELGSEILELEHAPAPGTPIEQALRRHPRLIQVLRESFTMSNLPNRAEIDLRYGPHRDKRIGFTLSLIADDAGRIYGAAVFFKDLTQVEHKEEQDRLKDRLAALGRMAANLAHEMRNPLASIKVSCSLLKRRLGESGETAELIDKIMSEVVRLNRTITSSLDFVRPLPTSLELAQVQPVILEALEVARGRCGRAGVRFDTQLDPSVPAFLMDRGQIRQVFENLFLNAMQAMGDSGTLTVQLAVVAAPGAASIPYRPDEEDTDSWPAFDSYVQVRVVDTGPGIDEKLRDRLFYPFFTTKKGGSGVGLSLSKKIVNNHRGLLDVDSRPGAGAAFTVRLPLVTTATAEG